MVHKIKGFKIEVYDEPSTIDRYIVAIDDYVFGMSDDPLSPLGFNQFSGMKKELSAWGQGKKILFKKLPKEVQKAIKERIKHGIKVKD